MSDSLIGVKGKDFVLIAADMTSAYSILKFKSDEDKVMELQGGKLFAIGGPVGDRLQFGNFIDKNMRYLKYKNNGQELSTRECAHFIRGELAKAIRKSTVQCNTLLAGYDQQGPQLYWIDYLGTLCQSNHICQGYALNFLMGIFDRLYKQDMDLEEAKQLLRYCIIELKTRFLLGDDNFIVKCISKDGVSIIKL